MRLFLPPMPVPLSSAPSVFLAGSIDMGEAADWQSRVASALEDLDVDVLNPRRADWDASWRQSIDDDRFRRQVEWELAGLERARVVAMHFEPESRSPVTLLELGLVAKKRLVVHCPHGYWRKGNVDVVCERYGIRTASSLEDLVRQVRALLA